MHKLVVAIVALLLIVSAEAYCGMKCGPEKNCDVVVAPGRICQPPVPPARVCPIVVAPERVCAFPVAPERRCTRWVKEPCPHPGNNKPAKVYR